MYYRKNDDNSIFDFSNTKYSNSCLETSENILLSYNGKYYLESELPQEPLDQIKIRKSEEVKQAYLNYRNNEATVPSQLGFTADANTRAWTDVMSLIAKAQSIPKDEKIIFRAADNTFHEITKEQLNILLLEIIATGEDSYVQKWNKDQVIKVAKTKDELDAIDTTFKSPSTPFNIITLEELALKTLKSERAEAVSKIIVEVDGMKFDGDEEAQTRMGRTIAAAVALGVDIDTYTQTWVLADNTIATPTIKQLAQALKLAGEEQTKLWTVPYETEDTSALAKVGI